MDQKKLEGTNMSNYLSELRKLSDKSGSRSHFWIRCHKPHYRRMKPEVRKLMKEKDSMKKILAEKDLKNTLLSEYKKMMVRNQ